MSDLQVVLKDGDRAALLPEVVEEFCTAMRGEGLTPQADQYNGVRLIRNGMYHDKRSALNACCTGVADVITAVNFASEHNLPSV